jgi:predicted kinase
MKQVIFTVGPSASGKTTWANIWVAHRNQMKKLGMSTDSWVNINRDDIRAEVFKQKKNNASFKWSEWKWKWEDEVTSIQRERIQQAIADGVSVVISDTNLNQKYLHKTIEIFTNEGYEVTYRYFTDASYNELIARDNQRANGVGYSVIRKQWKDQLNLLSDQGAHKFYTPDLSKPKAILCDIDGTIAKMVDRGPFEWHKVGSDEPDFMMQFIISSWLSDSTNNVVFLSGRDSVCRNETVEWIKKHFNNVDFTDGSGNCKLYMRQADSCIPDEIIKPELFWNHVAPYYNIVSVFDDRPKVVRAWHDIGLKVWATGDQFIDF